MIGITFCILILLCLAMSFAPEDDVTPPAPAAPKAAEPEAAAPEPAAPEPVEAAPVEPAAAETVPVVQDVTIEALRKSYTEKLDGLKGKVSPANIAKLGALMTEGVLNSLVFGGEIATLIEGFLAVLSESKPILAAADTGKVLQDASKKESDPVGQWVEETYPETAAAK